jgi:hypothetical protein
MVSLSEIKNIAQKVRDKKIDEPYGQCFPASKALKKRLLKEFNVDKEKINIEEVMMGKRATRRHYVVAFPAHYVEDTSSKGRILIDITLDQYCTEYEQAGKVKTSIGPKETIPKAVIYETKSQAPYTG